MYSVKPGRGPALMVVVLWLIGGLSVISVLIAMSSGGFDAIPAIFGAWFVLVGIVVVSFALHGAFARKRMSLYDIESSGEPTNHEAPRGEHRGGFCPSCGAQVEPSFRFCPKCGKPI